MRLRASEEAEIVGIDDSYLGEFAYDYVGLDPELRLHRIETQPGLTTLSGDVMDSSSSHASGDHHPEKMTRSAEGNEVAGGGRVDP